MLLKCHAGCTTEEICGALGITVADLFSESLKKEEKPRQEKREFVAKYDYTDENGAFLYRKTRYRTESGGKSGLCGRCRRRMVCGFRCMGV